MTISKYKTLYNRTGNILDINTILVPRDEMCELLKQAKRKDWLTEYVFYGKDNVYPALVQAFVIGELNKEIDRQIDLDATDAFGTLED